MINLAKLSITPTLAYFYFNSVTLIHLLLMWSMCEARSLEYINLFNEVLVFLLAYMESWAAAKKTLIRNLAYGHLS